MSGAQGDIVVVGVGMVTPLGPDLAQSAANIRAGLSAFEESSIMDKGFDPFVLATFPDDDLPPLDKELEKEQRLTYRESRMLRLAHLALAQIVEQMAELKNGFPLYAGLPEFQTSIPIDPDVFLKQLGLQCRQELDPNSCQAAADGRAGGLAAVHRAIDAIKQGKEKLVVAGGVDTFKDLYILGTLDLEKRINSPQTMDGFTPGEGAAFLALTTESYAREKGYTVIGRISASAIDNEPGHMYSKEPYKGEGLARAVQAALAQRYGTSGKVATVFSSMNGENHFAKEWGVAYIRNTDSIESEFRIEHPADCIGDTGAASGPIMVGLAMRGMTKLYLTGPTLVYASSDRALRAACVVTQT